MGGLIGILRGVTKGVDEAAGNQAGAQDIDQQQQQARAAKQQKLQMQLAPLHMASVGLQSQLAPLIDPDTGKPRVGYEARYNEVHDQLADIIGKQRMILNPPPKEDAHGLGHLANVATDKLHITRHAVAQAQEAQKKKMADYQQQGQDQVAQTVQGIQPSQLNPADTTEAARIKAQLQPKATNATEDWATLDVKYPDGSTQTVQRNKKDGRVTDLAGNAIPPEKISGAKSVPKTPASKTGLKFDTATGQAIDLATGKRYNAGDPSNPPEVNAMLTGSKQIADKKAALQARLVALRASTYNATKPMIVLDSNNGNAPRVATVQQIMASGGSLVPASEADKAITKENLMQDIAGSSGKTREAITNMKTDFPESMKAKIAIAMKADDPHAALDQLFASGALGSLTPDQQDVYVATQQLAEQGMAMRSVLGAGTGSDTMRAAMRSTLPSLISPDKAFAMKQLDAFDATVRRLHRGVPNVKLNETPMATPTGPKTQSLQHTIGEIKKFPNGKTGKWDGTGWALQP